MIVAFRQNHTTANLFFLNKAPRVPSVRRYLARNVR